MKRILLFSLSNIAVLAVLTVVLHFTGLDHWLYARKGITLEFLLLLSAIFGFAGSLFSLAISKWLAKWSYDIHIIQQPDNQAEQWLLDTIARLAKQAGVKMPEVGVYESPEVNAFATGPSRNNALVAVSSGLVHQMNLRQIEGVLAHEMSHVSNGDMVTMTLLQGVLNTFVLFFSYIVGFALDAAMRGRDEERRSGGIGIGFYLGQIVTQILLGIVATMIVMAYSRHREYGADALGAKLAGKDNMISALRRLKEITETGGVIDNRSEAVAAFKINNPTGLLALFASHPPLETRIAALERLKA